MLSAFRQTGRLFVPQLPRGACARTMSSMYAKMPEIPGTAQTYELDLDASKLPAELAITEDQKSEGLLSGNIQEQTVEGAATVAEITVWVNFVGVDGARYRVPGRVGQTVLEVARMHRMGFEGIVEWSPECHVVVANEYYEKMVESSPDEKMVLNDIEERSQTSRLACQLKLTKEVNEITIAVPTANPWYIP